MTSSSALNYSQDPLYLEYHLLQYIILHRQSELSLAILHMYGEKGIISLPLLVAELFHGRIELFEPSLLRLLQAIKRHVSLKLPFLFLL